MENGSERDVYVVKYALTRGILKIRAVICGDRIAKDVNYINKVGGAYFGEGREWTFSRDDAIDMAHDMRTRKIESLRLAIRRLEKKEFS